MWSPKQENETHSEADTSKKMDSMECVDKDVGVHNHNDGDMVIEAAHFAAIVLLELVLLELMLLEHVELQTDVVAGQKQTQVYFAQFQEQELGLHLPPKLQEQYQRQMDLKVEALRF